MGIGEDKKVVLTSYALAETLLNKTYVKQLKSYELSDIGKDIVEDKEYKAKFDFLKIERIAYNKEEINIEKLLNVYYSVYSCDGSLVLLFCNKKGTVDFYIGTKAVDVNTENVCIEVLKNSIKGNFPGLRFKKYKDMSESEVPKRTDSQTVLSNAIDKKSIAIVTGIPSLRKETSTEAGNSFVQGIEKLFEAMRDKEFSLLMIADPISYEKMNMIKNGYEDLYSKLFPLSSAELSYGETKSQSLSEALVKGISNSISENTSVSKTEITGRTINTSYTTSVNQGVVVGVAFGKGRTEQLGTAETTNTTEGDTLAKGSSFTEMVNFGLTGTKMEGVTETYQRHFTNRCVKSLLDKIDKQLLRMEQCKNVGMWNFATYILAPEQETAKVVAAAYQSLMRGKESGYEMGAISVWDANTSEDGKDKKNVEIIHKHLLQLEHPVFGIKPLVGEPVPVTPASLISGEELTIAAGWPQKSLPDIPVFYYEQFGRDIIYQDKPSNKGFSLGKIYHMGEESDRVVKLDTDRLTGHMFVTGTTGSGKSNTVFKLIEGLLETSDNINFMVVEPVKGEYKNKFKNANVYGSNLDYTDLLKINPFKFPSHIHVLEHIDRLIEIFNVCWPMYAAMPAILKDALLRSYEECGWDLTESKNIYGNDKFPNFMDLLDELIHVISNSAYSEEVKSNYAGSLLTRVKDLTKGFYGQIFCADEIDEKTLFDGKVIIDLSRIGSLETKSLIMGILIMRLSEHRMGDTKKNQDLKHITVLEEAHNILKRTSTEQDIEKSNVVGKSVEMISNAIAEMRTYGEGFIIVDQSPNAIDISAIRNTNTKIIMRLPDEMDRRLAGKAVGLKEGQLDEIARLPKGVAVVYQNDWAEPVLCKIVEFKDNKDNDGCNESEKGPHRAKGRKTETSKGLLEKRLLEFILSKRVKNPIDSDIDEIVKLAQDAAISTKRKISIQHLLNTYEEQKDLAFWQEEKFSELAKAVNEILDGDTWTKTIIKESTDFEMLTEGLMKTIENRAAGLGKEYSLAAAQCLLRKKAAESADFKDIYAAWITEIRNKGVI